MSKRSAIHLIIQFSSLLYLGLKGDLFPNLAMGIPAGLILLFIIWSIITAGVFNINIQPEVKPQAQLITRGPFSILRHPIYTGLMLYSLFICIDHSENWDLWLAFSVLVINFDLKARYEEKLLLLKFSSYVEYMGNTSRFVPFLY